MLTGLQALHRCSDMIRGNAKIQERFAHNKVHGSRQVDTHINGNSRKSLDSGKVYVIDALLNAALSNPSVAMFDVRYAACTCIQAYFHAHEGIRHHFLKRAIEGHNSGQDETSNVLTIMIRGPSSYESKDPYRLWFAARIVFELIYDDLEAKKMAMEVVEGDAASGEEVVTCIQSIAGNLVASLQSSEDERVCIGYLMVLCGWLFEDNAAVNDFLGEGSVVQSIIQVICRKDKGRELVQGLCTILLGILYEFSTKDSPIPRRQLQPMLISGLTREHYIARITRLREDSAMRDFEVLPQNLSGVEPGELPLVFFDQVFVNFVKDNFSRVVRAIDRDPGKEVVQAQEGVDRDLVDELRAQIESKRHALEKAEADFLALEQKHNQVGADHRRALETSSAEVTRIRNINEALRKSGDDEAEKLDSAHKRAMEQAEKQHRTRLEDAERRLKQTASEAAMRAHSATQQHIVESAGLKRRIQDLETLGVQAKQKSDALQQSLDSATESIRSRDTQIATLRTDLQQRDTQIASLRQQLVQQQAQIENAGEDVKDLNAKLEQSGAELHSVAETASRLQKEKKDLEAKVAGLTASMEELESTVKEHSDRATQAIARETNLKTLNTELLGRDKTGKGRIQELEKNEANARKEAAVKEEARQAAQSELDDLLIVLSDLEEKRARDKVSWRSDRYAF